MSDKGTKKEKKSDKDKKSERAPTDASKKEKKEKKDKKDNKEDDKKSAKSTAGADDKKSAKSGQTAAGAKDTGTTGDKKSGEAADGKSSAGKPPSGNAGGPATGKAGASAQGSAKDSGKDAGGGAETETQQKQAAANQPQEPPSSDISVIIGPSDDLARGMFMAKVSVQVGQAREGPERVYAASEEEAQFLSALRRDAMKERCHERLGLRRMGPWHQPNDDEDAVVHDADYFDGQPPPLHHIASPQQQPQSYQSPPPRGAYYPRFDPYNQLPPHRGPQAAASPQRTSYYLPPDRRTGVPPTASEDPETARRRLNAEVVDAMRGVTSLVRGWIRDWTPPTPPGATDAPYASPGAAQNSSPGRGASYAPYADARHTAPSPYSHGGHVAAPTSAPRPQPQPPSTSTLFPPTSGSAPPRGTWPMDRDQVRALVADMWADPGRSGGRGTARPVPPPQYSSSYPTTAGRGSVAAGRGSPPSRTGPVSHWQSGSGAAGPPAPAPNISNQPYPTTPFGGVEV